MRCNSKEFLIGTAVTQRDESPQYNGKRPHKRKNVKSKNLKIENLSSEKLAARANFTALTKIPRLLLTA